jgi:DNA invertase Pin-like site-specific DNA recombinase
LAQVIWRLDRLGRLLKDLNYLVERLDAAGVGLRSSQERIDTALIGGRLVFHLFGALTKFERNLRRSSAVFTSALGARNVRIRETRRLLAPPCLLGTVALLDGRHDRG